MTGSWVCSVSKKYITLMVSSEQHAVAGQNMALWSTLIACGLEAHM